MIVTENATKIILLILVIFMGISASLEIYLNKKIEIKILEIIEKNPQIIKDNNISSLRKFIKDTK